MIDQLTIVPYRLPLARRWQSARGGFSERSGWLVRVEAGGLCGYGDCAPLPEAGTEDPGTALTALLGWRACAAGSSLETMISRIHSGCPATPAARYAIECALLDLSAQRAGLPLRRRLASAAGASVAVNAALGPVHRVTPEAVRACCRSGFRVLKVKVGLDAPAVELARLTELALHLAPGCLFRLDANGVWSAEDAERMIEGLNALPIESLEEPLREPDAGVLRRLQGAARFPLALDETLHLQSPNVGLAALPVRRVIIKPAVVGGLRRGLQLANRAAALGIQVVLTSVVETAAGLWPTLQLAAAIGSPLAHGLATSAWLARDLGQAPLPVRGRIRLPERPGSGFRPQSDRPLSTPGDSGGGDG